MTRLLYPVEEAAELLAVSRSTIYALLDAGALQSVKIGRARRIPATALEAFVAELAEGER